MLLKTVFRMGKAYFYRAKLPTKKGSVKISKGSHGFK